MSMKLNYIHILSLVIALLCSVLNSSAQDIEANGIFYNIISDTQVAVAPAVHDGVNHPSACTATG